MRRKVVIETNEGPQTIEGLTVSAARKLLEKAPDDSVLVFMFEMTPTVRRQMNQVDMMIMPAHAVYGGDNSEVCCIVGPEIENAKFEDQYRSLPPEPPPVDRTNVCTTDGQPLDQRPETDSPDGQHKNYKVLCERCYSNHDYHRNRENEVRKRKLKRLQQRTGMAKPVKGTRDIQGGK